MFTFVLCSDKINTVSTVKINNIYESGINSPKWPCLNTFPSPTCSPSSLHPEKNCLKIGVSPPSTTRVTCVHWGYPFLLINSFKWQKWEISYRLLQKYCHYILRDLFRIPQSCMGNNNRRNWGKEKRWQDLLKKHLKILYWPSTREREREYAGDPERARRVNLARSGIQSKCRIRFIFPARGFSHKMKYNTTDLILRGQYLLQR